MARQMKSVPLLLLLCVSAVVGISKRSARWDAHLDHLRSKRDSEFPPGCNWQSLQEPGGCTLEGVMENDVLGRRASGLLATPETQGDCGSCWAFASAHAYTDTRSIAANVATPPLAPQHPTSCYRDRKYVVNGNGCCGASPMAGFLFFGTTGAVTATCAPYTLAKYYDAAKLWRRKIPISQTCPATCADGTTFNPAELILYGVRLLQTEPEVIQELTDRAVFIATDVSASFVNYKCGVFCEAQNYESKGGHAMEIVDYGTENGVDFWVVKNSWGTDQGEGGYFRMRRGDSNTLAYLAPVLNRFEIVTPVEDLPNDVVNSFSCAATDIENPADDELVLSAVEHTIDQINEKSSIPCPDGRAATAVVLCSVTDANTQVVDGIVVELDLQVHVRGCEHDEQRARVTSIVMLEDNGMFGAASFNHTFATGGEPRLCGRSSAAALTSSVAIILFATATILLLAR